MWDPLEQWRSSGAVRPISARPRTFGDCPLALNADELWGADVVVSGAPVDARVSGRSGARWGPRAICEVSFGLGWNVSADGTRLGQLGVVDYGDAPVAPTDGPSSVFKAIAERTADVLRVGALPLLMGGDHSVTAAAVAACAQAHGPLCLVQLDAHADLAPSESDGPPHHGAVVRWLVERGHVRAERSVQLGLRGFWCGPEVLAWQEHARITTITAERMDALDTATVVDQVRAIVGDRPSYLTIDLDVVDPAFAPSVGTPEPGGLTGAAAMRLVRSLSSATNLVGADVVELIGDGPPGDPSAPLAERLMREVLTGRALSSSRSHSAET